MYTQFGLIWKIGEMYNNLINKNDNNNKIFDYVINLIFI